MVTPESSFQLGYAAFSKYPGEIVLNEFGRYLQLVKDFTEAPLSVEDLELVYLKDPDYRDGWLQASRETTVALSARML